VVAVVVAVASNSIGWGFPPKLRRYKMACNCNPDFHKGTSLSTTGVLTVTNADNIANLSPFFLVLCVNPNSVITGVPVNYTMVINGATANLVNRFGLPISTDRLTTRHVYHGRYIVPETGTPYVILLDTPCNIAYALSSASVAVQSETNGD
jgi:hypothetical protein